jgi:hypothetical protein
MSERGLSPCRARNANYYLISPIELVGDASRDAKRFVCIHRDPAHHL